VYRILGRACNDKLISRERDWTISREVPDTVEVEAAAFDPLYSVSLGMPRDQVKMPKLSRIFIEV
jgi:hypothetical protein